MGQTAKLGLLNPAGRNAGPLLNDPSQILHIQLRPGLGLQFLLLLLQAHIFRPDIGETLIGFIHALPLNGFPLSGQSVQRALNE